MVKSILIIDSKDRDSQSNSTSDFFISSINYQNINKFTIKEIQIPISWYNIRPTQQNIYINNTLITIPSQSYTATSLLTQLQTLLSGYTITYNSSTLKFTFSLGTNFIMNCSQWDVGMLKILGFNNSDLSGSNTYTSQNMINMNPDTKITLHSSLCQKIDNTIVYSDYRSKLLLDIPIFSNLNTYQLFQPINPITFNFKSELDINKIDFNLRDKQNNIIDLNGLDTIFKIELE